MSIRLPVEFETPVDASFYVFDLSWNITKSILNCLIEIDPLFELASKLLGVEEGIGVLGLCYKTKRAWVESTDATPAALWAAIEKINETARIDLGRAHWAVNLRSSEMDHLWGGIEQQFA